MPKVSIIIPVYNAEKFISKTLESVIAQTYSNWEIVAVNDGSIDNSLKILKKYSKKYPSKILVINQKNAGVSAARNNAIKASHGEYIAFLDHDDIWLPNKLEKQVELLDSNKKLGLVYSDSYVIDIKSKIKTNTIVRGRFFKGKTFNMLFEHNFIPLSTAIIRKKLLNETGMFDPKYKIAEEYDLWLKIAEISLVDFIKEPLAEYRIHEEMFSRHVELSAKEEFQIINYWTKKKPEIVQNLLKKKRARVCFRTGWGLYKQKQFKESIKWYKRAMKENFLYYKTYIAFPFSVFKTKILMKILNVIGIRFVRF